MSDSLSSASLLLLREDGFRLECSFEFPNSGITVLFGASGSGKTTLLQCIGGLDRFDKGLIEIGGENIAELSEQRLTELRNRKLGFVYQFHHLLPEFTAMENVAMPLKIRREKASVAQKRAESLLKAMGLSKIDELPEELKNRVDILLMDTSNTYQYISEILKSEGYAISKSSVGRYAMRSNTAMQRLLEAKEQTEKLVAVVRKNPDADYTEAAMVMLMDGLINKLATAEDEFDQMPLDKAGRLITSLSRTKVYKDRVRQDMQKKADLAFKELESSMMKVIKEDEVSRAAMQEIIK